MSNDEVVLEYGEPLIHMTGVFIRRKLRYRHREKMATYVESRLELYAHKPRDP